MDHTGFPRAYLLDLHHIAGHPRRRKFNCRPGISQGGGVTYSPWLDGAFPDPARCGIHRLRKILALSDYLQSATNLDGEPKLLIEVKPLFPLERRRCRWSSLLFCASKITPTRSPALSLALRKRRFYERPAGLRRYAARAPVLQMTANLCGSRKGQSEFRRPTYSLYPSPRADRTGRGLVPPAFSRAD